MGGRGESGGATLGQFLLNAWVYVYFRPREITNSSIKGIGAIMDPEHVCS